MEVRTRGSGRGIGTTRIKTDAYGGSWYQTSQGDFNLGHSNNVTSSGNGSDAYLHLNTGTSLGNLTSAPIELPSEMRWSLLAVAKTEPGPSSIIISILNASGNGSIPGFRNISIEVMNISSLNDAAIRSIRLRAVFQGNETITPRLNSWGVEWMIPDAWRDGLISSSRTNGSSNAKIDGNATIHDIPGTAWLYSEDIRLPGNNTWAQMMVVTNVPPETRLEISLYNAMTDEVLIRTNATGDPSFGTDLSSIDSLHHTDVRLGARFISNATHRPYLHCWAIRWSPIEYPEFTGRIDDIVLTEDMPDDAILDLNYHSTDRYRSIRPSLFSVHNCTDTENLTIVIDGSVLGISGMAANWTGQAEMVIECTNAYGRKALSIPFTISVTGVNDPPVWISIPTDISMKEDTVFTSNYSLTEFVQDPDGDELEFYVTASEDYLHVERGPNSSIIIVPSDNRSGHASITITVTERTQDRLSANVTINVTVEAVDDPPVAALVFPGHEAVVTGGDIMLVWEVSDADGPSLENARFDLYLGTNGTPGLYLTGIRGSSRPIEGLSEGATYHWYVVPVVDEVVGECREGPRKFHINSSKKPRSVELVSPLNETFTNDSRQELTWKLTGQSLIPGDYYIFAGVSQMHLELAAVTTNTYCRMDALRDNDTYYWMVLPASGKVIGDCASGFWEFTYMDNFIGKYLVEAYLDVGELRMEAGRSGSFNLTVINTGTMPLETQIWLGGSMAQFVEMRLITPLGIGERETVEGRLSPGIGVVPGKYNLTLEIRFECNSRELLLGVDVWTEEDGKDERPGKVSTIDPFWLILDLVALAFLLAGIFALVRKRRKAARSLDDEEEDKVEESPRRGGQVYYVDGRHILDRYGQDGSERGVNTEVYTRDILGASPPPRPPKWISEDGNEKNDTGGDHFHSEFTEPRGHFDIPADYPGDGYSEGDGMKNEHIGSIHPTVDHGEPHPGSHVDGRNVPRPPRLRGNGIKRWKEIEGAVEKGRGTTKDRGEVEIEREAEIIHRDGEMTEEPGDEGMAEGPDDEGMTERPGDEGMTERPGDEGTTERPGDKGMAGFDQLSPEMFFGDRDD